MYEGCQIDKNDNGTTPLSWWIGRRPGEAIPKELFYPNCEKLDRDNSGYTPLMWWFIERPDEPAP